MGVDIATYRAKIGLFNTGKCSDVQIGFIYLNIKIWLQIIGTVTFINTLLLISGIEPNPGPLPRPEDVEDGDDKLRKEKKSELKQESKNTRQIRQEIQLTERSSNENKDNQSPLPYSRTEFNSDSRHVTPSVPVSSMVRQWDDRATESCQTVIRRKYGTEYRQRTTSSPSTSEREKKYPDSNYRERLYDLRGSSETKHSKNPLPSSRSRVSSLIKRWDDTSATESCQTVISRKYGTEYRQRKTSSQPTTSSPSTSEREKKLPDSTNYSKMESSNSYPREESGYRSSSVSEGKTVLYQLSETETKLKTYNEPTSTTNKYFTYPESKYASPSEDDVNSKENIHSCSGFQNHGVESIVINAGLVIFGDRNVVAEKAKDDMASFTSANFSDDENEMTTSEEEETELILMVEGLDTWINHPRFQYECHIYLQEMLRKVQAVQKTCNDENIWLEQLQRKKALQEFLAKIARIETNFPNFKLKLARSIMQTLISHAGSEDFPSKSLINEWINYRKIQSSITVKEFKNVAELLKAIKDRFLPEVLSYKERQDIIGIFITSELALAVTAIQVYLRRKLDNYELAFLKALLLPLSYNTKLKTFEVLLTISSLESFLKNSATSLRKYEYYSSCGKMQKESFLINLALINTCNIKVSHTREKLFVHTIEPIRKYLDCNVHQTINKYATVSPFEFDVLKRYLQMMMKGDISFSTTRILSLDRLEESLNIVTKGKKSFNGSFNKSLEECDTKYHLLKFLSLEDVYPGKISVQDVMSIKPEKKNSYIQQRDLPWKILQKIIMCDYRARDHILQEYCSQIETRMPIPTDDDGLDKVVDDITATLMGTKTDENLSLHPLDIFITIFSCCDQHLKQIIVNKLFLCQLAIPLVYRSLSNTDLYFCLWPLRTLVTETKEKEISLATHAIKCVSFFRFDRSDFSKSKLINMLLRDKVHNTFHNEDCPFGTIKKDIADGLIETTWFLPSTPHSQSFSDILMFLNLRGDGIMHHKQMNFLKQISNVFIVLTDVEKLNEKKHLELLISLYNRSAFVVLLISSRDQNEIKTKDSLISYLRSIGANKKRTTIHTLVKGKQRRSAEDIKKDIWSAIEKAVESQSGRTLIECGVFANNEGIINDEDASSSCSKGQRLAKQLFSKINMTESIKEIKEANLPLQGILWTKWSELQRKEKKMGQNLTTLEIDELEIKKKEIRKKQVAMCMNLTQFMHEFIRIIIQLSDDKDDIQYFIAWLKQELDQKSRAVLPNLRKRYLEHWVTFKSNKDSSKASGFNVLKQNVIRAEEELASASFGFEHLLREIGQMYEAIMETSEEIAPSTEKTIQQLPTIVAKFLLYGQPLEIMDGDTANVPLKWIKAVFDELVLEIGDKKVFSLSVVGIQSSGKSTLLNAMFGLQFSVSAGRCTRGVYMQLLPVQKESSFGFEYVFIFDTEGLRAPELYNKKFDHDNRLATFVIGMGDITIVNIKGENTTEVNDVLQIVVHAFLRLILANDTLNLRQSCIFVHQNVASINAADKLSQGRHRIVEQLDSITHKAAKLEHQPEIQSFNQVIDFDSEKHCWYFSDFLNGDPPIAPVNPGYSDNVQEVKTSVLETLPLSKGTFLSISDTSAHIADLWNGILSDDFVFGFRNSLEVRVYSIMESKFLELCYKIEMFACMWIEDEMPRKLKQFNSAKDIEQIANSIIEHLEKDIQDFACKILDEFDEFYEQCEHKQILFQWKEFKDCAFQDVIKYHVSRSRDSISETLDEIKLERKSKLVEKELERTIYEKSQIWAEELKGDLPHKNQLRERFEKIWVPFSSQQTSQIGRNQTLLQERVKQKLYDFFPQNRPLLDEELKNWPLSKALNVARLHGSFPAEDINCKLLSIRLGPGNKIRKSATKICFKKAAMFTDLILQKIDDYLFQIQSKDSKCKDIYISTILRIIIDQIEIHTKQYSDAHKFDFKPTYNAKLAVHVCRFALIKFEEINTKFEKKHCFIDKLADMKEKSFKIFESSVIQRTEEITASTILGDVIEKSITKYIEQKVRKEITSKILSEFKDKRELLLRIMQYLASGDNFDHFRQYLVDPYNFAYKYITYVTNSTLFDNKIGGTSLYSEISEDGINVSIKHIEDAIKNSVVSKENDGFRNRIEQWIIAFESKLRILDANVFHCVKATGFDEILQRSVKDLRYFETNLTERLSTISTNLKECQRKQSKDNLSWTIKSPYEILINNLWGCTEVCPFCYEPCMSVLKDHVKYGSFHNCIEHRPLGLSGICDENNELVLNPCSYLVQTSTAAFPCSLLNFRCRDSGTCDHTTTVGHKFRDYEQYFRDWHIYPKVFGDCLDYWKWFIATYRYNLAEFDKRIPSIPPSWETISRERAIQSLKFE